MPRHNTQAVNQNNALVGKNRLIHHIWMVHGFGTNAFRIQAVFRLNRLWHHNAGNCIACSFKHDSIMVGRMVILNPDAVWNGCLDNTRK